MNTHLLFEFSVNKEDNSIHISRQFAADKETVWEAWTKAEYLDQWWAPKPYRAVTKHMDFSVGGHWLYAMISPENEYHWCIVDYLSITPQQEFSGNDAFCNEDGEVNTSLPRAQWHNTFVANGESTTVQIHVQYQSMEDIETIIKMGFKEGIQMSMNNLDQYIEAQFKLRQQNKTSRTARVSTYLNFPGNTEEAFEFYKSVFRAEFSGSGIHRFGEVPPQEGQPPVAESLKNMILHIELPITGGHILMGTDAPKEMGFTVTMGNNMHINIEPDSREEATRIFNELSACGTVSMPLQDMFWGAYFGSFTDKYGVNWMINHQSN